jgi:signal transduction histidine kinase
VGLAGIRERVREQGGKFELHSDQTGTTLSVTMPVTATISEKDNDSFAAAAPAD